MMTGMNGMLGPAGPRTGSSRLGALRRAARAFPRQTNTEPLIPALKPWASRMGLQFGVRIHTIYIYSIIYRIYIYVYPI